MPCALWIFIGRVFLFHVSGLRAAVLRQEVKNKYLLNFNKINFYHLCMKYPNQ